MTNTLKILIVDDEFHARKLLSEYVSKLSFLTLAGTAFNVFEAMNILQNERIDIMLLDIQMPEITGLDFARSLKTPPAIIFTTAYSEYAVESYELDVADYLLKPIAFPRFLQAINKVTERKGVLPVNKTTALEILPTPAAPAPVPAKEESMVIKSGTKRYRIHYADLLYIEGQREYVTFHTVKQRITTLFSLKELEERLPSSQFIRIHKSYIVSIKHIDSIERSILHIGNTKLSIGGSYRENLLDLFEDGDDTE